MARGIYSLVSKNQLKEIRKTTLARIICDTSDGITQVQQEVMQSISDRNPMVSCEDIPQFSIDAWKTDIPILTLSDSEIKFQDWINFKSEVNKTLTDIISNIVGKKPPPGTLPADWITFQTGINKTFTDLKNKFNALHPKFVTNLKLTSNLTPEQDIFDWMSIKNEVENTFSDIIHVISARKPPPGSLPTDWLEFKKQINDSLVDVKNKFKISDSKSTVSKSISDNQLREISITDWTQIKNDINSTITDIVNSINASKPLPGSAPADWFEFKNKLVNSLSDIKNKFKGLHPKPTVNINSPGNLITDETGFDWKSVKDAMDDTVLEIIDDINANKPPPGSLPVDWLEFKKKINDSLVDIKKKYKIFHPKSNDIKSNLENKSQLGDTSITDWTQIKNDINSTIADIVNSINASKPLPGSTPADWFAFKNKIVNSLFDIKNKFKGLHPKPTVKTNSPGNLVDETSFDWKSVEDAVNDTISEIIDAVNANKPSPGSLPIDWWEFKKKINDSLADITKKFKIFHPKSSPIKSKSKNIGQIGSTSIADWVQLKNDINTTIADFVNSINASRPLPGSPPADWFAFKSKILNSLADIRNKFQSFLLKDENSTVKLSRAIENSTFDWLGFKEKLNTPLNSIIVSLDLKKPSVDSKFEDWLQIQKDINNTFDDFAVSFSNLDQNFNINSDKLLSNKKSVVSKNNVNKTVSEIISEINASKPAAGSPQKDWDMFRQKMTDAFADMKNKYAFSQNRNKSILVKLSDSWINNKEDVVSFQENFNVLLINLTSVIENCRLAINSSTSDWVVYKNEVEILLDKISDLFSKINKQELYTRESDGTADWIKWKTEINKTIDNLIDDVTNTSLNGDPKWISFRDYLSKYLKNLKNKASLPRTKPNLMTLVQQDWFVFKDKVMESIAETLDDISNNKSAPEDTTFLNYSMYINRRFALMQETLKATETEWLQNLKLATDMMIVTDVPIANNAASLLRLPRFNFSNIFFLFTVCFTHLMRRSI